MRTRRAFSLAAVALGCTQPVLAVDWPQPYDIPLVTAREATMGGFLERHFSQLLAGCALPALVRPRVWPLADVPLSAIPDSLHQLPLDKTVVIDNEKSLARLFAYVFRGSSSAPQAVDAGRFLNADFVASPAGMLPAGTTSAIVSHTCGSIINAAANGTAKVPVPEVLLKAALSAQTEAKESHALAVVYGTFESPIRAALDRGSAAEKLHTSLLIWDWYAKHPIAERGAPHYLSSAGGVALFFLRQGARSASAGANLQAGASLPFISLDAHVVASLRNASETKVEAYATALYKPESGAAAYSPLPAAQELADSISQQRAVVEPGYQHGLAARQAYDITLAVAGVPSYMCKRDLWNATPPMLEGKPAAAVDIDAAEPHPADSRTCRFTLNMAPAGSLIDALSAGFGIPLTFGLASRSKVDGASFEIRSQQATFTAAGGPEVLAGQTNPVPRATAAGLEWRAGLYVDSVEPLDWSNLKRSDGVLACVDGHELKVELDASASGKAVAITITRKLDRAEDLDTSGRNGWVDCTLSGTLKLRTQKTTATIGRPIDIAIPNRVVLNYPQGAKRTSVAASAGLRSP